MALCSNKKHLYYKGGLNINGNFYILLITQFLAKWYRVQLMFDLWGVGTLGFIVSTAMAKQEVHLSVAQHTIINFLTNEGVKSSDIFSQLKTVQFGNSTLSQNRVYT